jgi:hypothetical protein
MFSAIPRLVLATLAIYTAHGPGTAEAQFRAAQEPPTAAAHGTAGEMTLAETQAALREADQARRRALRNEFAARKQAIRQLPNANFNGMRGADAPRWPNGGVTRNPGPENNSLPLPAPGIAAGTFGSGAPFDSFRVYPNSFPIPYQGWGTPRTQFLAPNPMYAPAFGRTYSNAPARIQSANPNYNPAFGRTYANRP